MSDDEDKEDELVFNIRVTVVNTGEDADRVYENICNQLYELQDVTDVESLEEE